MTRFRIDLVRHLVLWTSIVLLCLFNAGEASAAPADLDSTFGAGGKLTHSIVPGGDVAEGLAIQADGKIVAAGSAYVIDLVHGTGYDFAVARFNADGSPDTTFGGDGDGDVTIRLGTTRDDAHAVAIQSDSKIVVAGDFDGGPKDLIGIVRFDTDGTLDSTFGGGDGIANFGFGGAGTSDAYADALAIQPDGKIVMAGHTKVTGGTNDFAVVRVNPDGTPDNTFGTLGKVVTPIGSSNDSANAIAIQPDGKLVLVGQTDGGASGFDFAVVRYESNGALDTSFNGTGIQTTSLSGADYAETVAIRPDGTIIVAGGSRVAGVDNAALVRYASNGALDGSFGVGGAVSTFAAPGETYANALALQNNDKMVVAGWYYDGLNYDYFLAQYNSTGALDTSFDGDGILIAGVGAGDDHANALAIQPDGKIVAGGQSNTGADFDFSLARFSGERQILPTVGPVAPVAPIATIISPSGKRVPSRKMKRFAGTAGPAGEVARTDVALRRVDRRALRKGRCLWMRNSKAKFVKTKARNKRCSSPRFLRAAGTESWSYKLRRKLPRGSYELFVRVTLKNGTTQSSFTAVDGNFRIFRVT